LAEQRIRVVVSKVGLDGHDRGVKVIAQGLRDAGMEVVYAGLRRTPEELAEITIQEDADLLGLSILSGAVVPLARRVRAALDERDLTDVPIVVGGIVSPDVERQLAEAGVAAAFGPGSPMTDVVAAVERLATART
jgi:methylmalonyl-CoA mutase C-terminal domain/subunit